MPDPFMHSEGDWSSYGCWDILNESKKLWHEDHKTFLVAFDFQQHSGTLAFSSDAAGLQSTDNDKVKSTDI